MRLPWALVLGALVGIAQANDAIQTDSPDSQTALVRRQDDSSSTTDAPPPADTTSADTGGSDSTTSDGGDSGGDTTTSDAGSGGDTTVFRTTTVTNDDASTVSSKTTVLVTSTSIVVITHTDFTTTTVTSSDQKTATKTVYETSTSIANEKRALNLAPRTVGPADAEAAATISAPVPVNTNDSYELVKDKRDGNLAKRATVTEVKTVTAGGGDATTVVNTVKNTLVRTSTSDTTSVKVVTETEQADATTTRTITSTLIVVSTRVTTGESTQTQSDPASNPTDGSGNSDGDSSGGSGGDSGGLSGGAKAGIGAGVGVAALLVLGALAFFFIRRRRSGPKPHPDDFIGASEVPVGGPVGGGHRTPPMSQHSATAAAFLAPNRTPPKQSVSPEGYRGTAAGDGRAGYAKPAPFGSAYAQPTNRSSTLVSNTSTAPTNNDYLPEHSHPMPAEMGGAETAAATRQQPSSHAAELGAGGGGANKWHVTNAAEMDSSQAVTPVSPQSAAPTFHVQPPPPSGQDVYEMPAQKY